MLCSFSVGFFVPHLWPWCFFFFDWTLLHVFPPFSSINTLKLSSQLHLRFCNHPALCRKLKNSLDSSRPPLLSSLSICLSVSPGAPSSKTADRQKPTFSPNKTHWRERFQYRTLNYWWSSSLLSPGVCAEGCWEKTDLCGVPLHLNSRYGQPYLAPPWQRTATYSTPLSLYGAVSSEESIQNSLHPSPESFSLDFITMVRFKCWHWMFLQTKIILVLRIWSWDNSVLKVWLWWGTKKKDTHFCILKRSWQPVVSAQLRVTEAEDFIFHS